MDLADDAADVGDAYVTLCVHAGIAAAAVICARRLQRHSGGENHHEAVNLLARVEPRGTELSSDLAALLRMKTKAGYTHRPVSAQDRTMAGRRARNLVEAARTA